MTRKLGDKLILEFGQLTVKLQVYEINGKQLRFVITGPREVKIHREDLDHHVQTFQECSNFHCVPCQNGDFHLCAGAKPV